MNQIFSIMKLLWEQEDAPMSTGRIMGRVGCSESELQDALRRLIAQKIVKMDTRRVLLATHQSTPLQTSDPINTIFLQQLEITSPLSDQSFVEFFNIPLSDVRAHLRALDRDGMIGLESINMQFVTMMGGRWHIFKRLLAELVARH
jgi:DNA-binding GntR family transcriptional regulator